MLNTVIFNPNNWYWVVNNSATEVYSSAAGQYVSVTDSDFLAWKQGGYFPTQICSEEDLVAALVPHGVTVCTKVGLKAYANSKQIQVAASGIYVDVGSGQIVECYTNTYGIALLLGAVNYVANHSSVSWVQADGPVTLTADQVHTINAAVSDYIQNSFITLGQLITAINNGTVTTKDQVDSPPSPIPAWPTS